MDAVSAGVDPKKISRIYIWDILHVLTKCFRIEVSFTISCFKHFLAHLAGLGFPVLDPVL